ncbi:MAG: PilZ domain-containing protein [Terriglobales bacterium]
MCDRPATLQCSNCRRKVCVRHAIASEDAGILCSYCAIASKGLWPRVRPIPVNGSEHPEKWVPERRRFRRCPVDPRTYRSLASPEAWGLPITVTLHGRDLEAYCNQIAEGGLGVSLTEEVPVGSVVSLQFVVPPHATELRVQAVVRYQVGFQHGLEFTSLNEGERVAIRRFCNELPSVTV